MGGSNSTFGKSTTAEQAINGLDLTGKYCLITGCNTGIGKETARVLLKQNAHIIMACRSVDKAQEARKEIIGVVKADSEFKGNKDDLEKQITVEELDLGSLNSVKTFSEKFLSSNLPLHYLINNAGVMAIQDWQPTKDGIEMQFGTNHIGHFYLTTLLTPKLIASKPSRVIVVSSAAHRYAPASFPTWVDKHYKKTEGPDKESYGAFPNYGISKAANILFAREYNKRYFSQGVTAVSLHPGVIATELTRNLGSFKSTVFKTLGKPFFKSIPQGAATTVRCVSLTDSEIKPGGYYADCQDASDSLRADIKESNDSSPTSEEKLWTLSEKLIEKSLGSSNNVVPVSNNSNNIEEVKQN